MKPYYKKIDRSTIEWGLTIPKANVSDFLFNKTLRKGTSRLLKVRWDKKEYEIRICHVNRRGYTPVYQLRWDSNKEFLIKLRKTFIQSYVILKSQKELFDNQKLAKKHFRTDLEGGQQEVLIFKPLKHDLVEAIVFIKIENEWNTLFERLMNENAFGHIFEKSDSEYLIQKSTNWIKVKDFSKHKSATNVIYYLANSKTKILYIGKADIFGNRVRPGRKHQNMSGDWDLFKYDIVRPEYANLLKRIEDHTIRTIASILKNNNSYSTLGISNYTLVNSQWKKL